MSTVGGTLSSHRTGHFFESERQPNSAPLTHRHTRVGRYHGTLKSHSMSASYVNRSPSRLKAASYVLRHPVQISSHVLPSGSVFAIHAPGAMTSRMNPRPMSGGSRLSSAQCV